MRIHFDIILVSTPRFSKWPLSLRLPQQKAGRHTFHMPRTFVMTCVLIQYTYQHARLPDLVLINIQKQIICQCKAEGSNRAVVGVTRSYIPACIQIPRRRLEVL